LRSVDSFTPATQSRRGRKGCWRPARWILPCRL